MRIGKWVLFERAKTTAPNISMLFDDLKVDFLRIEHLQSYVNAYPCPKCKTKEQLKVLDYEIGITGWEVKVRCKKCHSQGIFNNTGFHFKMFNGEEAK